jgi:hypothetical protein
MGLFTDGGEQSLRRWHRQPPTGEFLRIPDRAGFEPSWFITGTDSQKHKSWLVQILTGTDSCRDASWQGWVLIEIGSAWAIGLAVECLDWRDMLNSVIREMTGSRERGGCQP